MQQNRNPVPVDIKDLVSVATVGLQRRASGDTPQLQRLIAATRQKVVPIRCHKRTTMQANQQLHPTITATPRYRLV